MPEEQQNQKLVDNFMAIYLTAGERFQPGSKWSTVMAKEQVIFLLCLLFLIKTQIKKVMHLGFVAFPAYSLLLNHHKMNNHHSPHHQAVDALPQFVKRDEVGVTIWCPGNNCELGFCSCS